MPCLVGVGWFAVPRSVWRVRVGVRGFVPECNEWQLCGCVVVGVVVEAIAFFSLLPPLLFLLLCRDFDFQTFVLNSRIYFIIIYIFV